MVTGAYVPETSGASLQCRQLMHALRNDAEFAVLTTTFDPALPPHDRVDGVDVTRIYVDPRSVASKVSALPRMAGAFLQVRRRFDIIHFHGFSQKTMPLIALARASGKRIVIKLTSFGHDDATAMKQRGPIAFRFYRAADRFIGVSPSFEGAHTREALPPGRYTFVPNGVDLDRFRPATDEERVALRQSLGIPANDPVVLFVGFFSPEKRPDLLYRAWARSVESGVASTLVFVGASRSAYYEIDPAMADGIRADAARRGLGDRLVFVERTAEIENFYRASDVFALPTLREGLPNVLLEAMASGVPPVITRLAGVTDWIVDDGKTGLLVSPNDEAALTDALRRLLDAPELRQEMGDRARESVANRFTIEQTAARTLAVYRELIACAA